MSAALTDMLPLNEVTRDDFFRVGACWDGIAAAMVYLPANIPSAVPVPYLHEHLKGEHMEWLVKAARLNGDGYGGYGYGYDGGSGYGYGDGHYGRCGDSYGYGDDGDDR